MFDELGQNDIVLTKIIFRLKKKKNHHNDKSGENGAFSPTMVNNTLTQ